MSTADIQRKIRRVILLCWGGYILFFLSLQFDAFDSHGHGIGEMSLPSTVSTSYMLMHFGIMMPFFGFVTYNPFVIALFLPVTFACFVAISSPIECYFFHVYGEERRKKSAELLAVYTILVFAGILFFPCVVGGRFLVGFYLWATSVLLSWAGLILSNK